MSKQEKDMQKEIFDRMLKEYADADAEKTPEQKKQESEEAKEKLVAARIKMLFNQFLGNIACPFATSRCYRRRLVPQRRQQMVVNFITIQTL